MTIKIGHKLTSDGYQINVNSNKFDLGTPDYWKGFKGKQVLMDNILYSKTSALRSIVGNITYNSSEPYMQEVIDSGLKGDIPRIADLNNEKTNVIFKRLKNSIIEFRKNAEHSTLEEYETDDEKTILGMSLGKDSLLSLALLNEIDLKTSLVFYEDMAQYNQKEFELKKVLLNKLSKQFEVKKTSVKDNTDMIYHSDDILNNFSEYDGTNAMMSFALQSIPISFKNNARHIIFGNEQNHNDFYLNDDGYKTYPSFDQTSDYTNDMNKRILKFTEHSTGVSSVVEPIYNLAEIKILQNRYPEYLRFMMSCGSKYIEKEKWCCRCPMCAKSFLFGRAIGVDLKSIGFSKNMFDEKFIGLYPLFSNPNRPYEKPKEQRDEQLLSFFLAYKNSVKGDLIRLFKNRFLDEAKEREDELSQKFLGIHKSYSMTNDIKEKIVSIFKEELE